ncbi:MAG: radical SAM protein [archaeon]
MKAAFFEYSLFYESLSISNLIGAAKAHGHECRLFVVAEEKDLIKSVRSYNPGLLCFSAVTGNQHISFQLAKYLKKHFSTPILFGGPHVTIFPEESIREDCVDMICRGEGEEPFAELLDLMEKGKDYSRTENIWTKKKGKIIRNDIRPLVQDLDSLPLPDRSEHLKYKILRDLPLKRFITGYGCPYHCGFCHNAIFLKEIYKGKGNYLRKKSVDRVFREIRDVKSQSRVEHIHFHDDNFNFHRVWLAEFCRRYPNEIGIPFSCTIRADILDEETVKSMRNAGCTGVTYGVETGNEKLRNQFIKKHLKNSDFERAAKLLAKYNIKHVASVMLNLPHEKLEDNFRTLHYLQKLRVSHIRASVYMITRKQPMIETLMEQQLIQNPPEIDNFNQKSITEITLPTPELKQIIRLAPLFNLMLKLPFMEPVVRVMIRLPIDRLTVLGRLHEAYLEMRFMGMPVIDGVKYYLKIRKTFKALQTVR